MTIYVVITHKDHGILIQFGADNTITLPRIGEKVDKYIVKEIQWSLALTEVIITVG
jgi:hypothetical protein